jgi:hypothetical protein
LRKPTSGLPANNKVSIAQMTSNPEARTDLSERAPRQVAYRQPAGVFAASIPRHVGLFREKQLRGDKPDNIFIVSRALNSKRVLPVLFQDLLPGYISRYNAPSAASLGAFAF